MRTTASRVLVVLVMALTLAATAGESWARPSSGGSRGSRSYSPPARPAPMRPDSPSTPSRAPSAPAASPAPRPSPFGGFMGALGGFMLGGLLGSLLFGGLGGGLGSGLGLGLMDLLLIGGGLFLLFRLMRGRRQEPAYAGAPGYGGASPRAWDTSADERAVASEPPIVDDLERGLGHLRQMDPRFDAAALAADGADVFRAVQGAVSQGDLTPVRGRLTPEMLSHIQAQSEALRGAGQRNNVERIQIERAEVTEAWQERGQDFVTVLLGGSLVDYTVDAAGTVVAGSRTSPERFEEFWTFTRPVGPNDWKLTAIQSG
jgi:predicted lipid-binding transport protein (Tim44 family)